MRIDRLVRMTLPVFLLLASTTAAQSPIPDVPSIRENHPPIFIDGDAEFLNPLNGVRSGNGGTNPYRISGWLIDPSFWRFGGTLSQVANVAIRLRNTTKNVIIDNNQLVYAGIAIQLENVSGNIVIGSNETGGVNSVVSVTDLHSNLNITGNTFGGGVSVAIRRGTGNVTIQGNFLNASGTRAIDLEGFSGTVLIRDNTIAGSPEDAAISVNALQATTDIVGNDIVCPGPGPILLPATERRAGVGALGSPGLNEIRDNEIRNCRNAVFLEDATATIEQNCFAANLNGVVLEEGSELTTVNFNDFLQNAGIAFLNDISGLPTIDAENNYWGTPTGPNPFGNGPERTYPHTLAAIDYEPFAVVKQAPLCGR